jgi:hypothetical protein
MLQSGAMKPEIRIYSPLHWPIIDTDLFIKYKGDGQHWWFRSQFWNSPHCQVKRPQKKFKKIQKNSKKYKSLIKNHNQAVTLFQKCDPNPQLQCWTSPFQSSLIWKFSFIFQYQIRSSPIRSEWVQSMGSSPDDQIKSSRSDGVQAIA